MEIVGKRPYHVQMMTKEELQARLRVAKLHQWLGLEVLEAGEAGITVKAAWRDEWIVNPARGYTHGGILATLVDVVADYALAAHLGGPAPTVDLRVDYHKAALQGDLTVKGRVVRRGGSFACCEAHVYDKDGELVASGRGTYALPQK
ncbi:MAG: PaaI family thioesterase [Burkholderiales bacterium]